MEMQFDCKGNHRISDGNKHGCPTMYEHPSLFRKDGKLYIALTPYYEGDLTSDEVETVYELKPVGKLRPSAVMYNFFRPDEKCPHGNDDNICLDCPEGKVGVGIDAKKA